MADVAKIIGVSTAAVSIALSGRASSTRLSAATREKILRTAKRLGYKPDIRGKSLRQQRSFIVAFLCRETFIPYAIPLLRGVQEGIQQRNYTVMTFSLGNSTADELEHIHAALDRRVDGLILTPAIDADSATNGQLLRAKCKEGFPVVQLQIATCPGVPFVCPNNRAAGAMLTRHLIELGHKRIVHLTHEFYRDHELIGYYQDPAEQAKGYTDEMRRASLSPRIVTHRGVQGNEPEFEDAMRDAVDVLLQGPDRPTAVTTGSYSQALSLMRWLYRRGLRVPEDISVATSCDVDATALFAPPLTAARWPLEEEGRAAAEMIFRLMDGETVEDITLEPELIIRESTAPLAPAGSAG